VAAPNHQQFLVEEGDDVRLLDDWYRGRTSFGIAVPSYTDITSLEDLNGSVVNVILGIEPGAAIMQKIPDSVMLAYDLEQVLVQASTPGNAPLGRQPLREPGGVRLHRLVLALDEPAVRLQVPRRPARRARKS
jgi:hypothetical protein